MPFHPVVVRGFSKYTRMATSRSSPSSSALAASRPAYSVAALESCTLHGPTTTSSRSSAPSSTADTWSRPLITTSSSSGVSASSVSSRRGVASGAIRAIR